MNDINTRINELVSTFVEEITRIAQAAAVETLRSALAPTGELPPSGRRVVTRGATLRAARAAKGTKRPKAEVAALQVRLLRHIVANPNQRVEQINKVLGTRTADLRLPIKKLLAAGSISATGIRRATTYAQGDGRGGKPRRGSKK